MKAADTVAPAKAPIAALWRIVRRSGLSDAAVRLWLFYRGLHYEPHSGAYPTDPMTANVLGWSTRKVQAARAELVGAGLLEVHQRGPRPPAYFPLDPAAPKGSQPVADQGSPNTATQGPQNPASLESKGSQQGSQNSVVVHKEITCKPVKPSTKGSEKPGLDPLVIPFAEAWEARYGREVPFGQPEKALRWLVDKHGADDVLAVWVIFLAQLPAQDATGERFLDTYDVWSQYRKPKNPGRDTWLTRFSDAWAEKCGGQPSFGQLAKDLKPLVDVHGSDAVLDSWRRYLAVTEARFVSSRRFAATYGSWSPAADPAIVRALRERDRANVPAG